jgi:dolichol-phosphate mannosyltransferase
VHKKNEGSMNRPESSKRGSGHDAMISVVLPVYNEVQVLPALLGRVSRALSCCACDYEVVFVDDGSNDGSPQVLDRLAGANTWVRVVHLTRNFGHQAAVQAGLAYTRGDAVILMDSDMQDTPEVIPQFVEKWAEGYNVVYAIRTQRKENRLKRFLFSAFYRLLARLASVRIPTDAGIFGLIDRRVATEISAMGERDRYFPGLRSWVGFRQTGIEVERSARYDDHARVSVLGLIRLAKTAIFAFSSFPLAIFYGIGAVASAVFLALAGYSLYCKLIADLAIPGWTSHILTGSFFGALNALGISVLGEYVIRIYDQVRGRPLYLVDRTVNLPPDEAALMRLSADDAPYVELLRQVQEPLGEETPLTSTMHVGSDQM